MIDKKHLKYVITEDLYLAKDQNSAVISEASKTASEEISGVSEKDDPEESSKEPIQKSENVRPSKNAWLLVATRTLNESEKELLDKILDAVNVKEEDYELEVGSTKMITSYKKAIIFSSQEVGTFYQVGNYKGTELLSARPLSEMIHSKEEKMKLWNALKNWFKIN